MNPDGIIYTDLKNFEESLFSKMEKELKHLDEEYYKKLVSYDGKSDKVKDWIVTELEEHASKDRKRILTIQEMYFYLKRCISIREELTTQIGVLKSELNNLKELL